MLRKVLGRLVRPDEETPGNWLEAELSLRRWKRWSWIAVLLIVGALAWSGCTLGKAAATPLGRAQAAVVDRAAARVSMPPLPPAPHYPPSTPMPLPSRTGSGTGTGARFAPGEATAFSQPGLPIAFMLPRASYSSWHCVVFSLPGVGAASAAEWECTDGSVDYPQEIELRVLLAACSQPCDFDARSRLRPPFAIGPVRSLDDTTWLADRTTEPDLLDDRSFHLVMEHVWKAPAGAFGPGSAAQTLYVAARTTVAPNDRATAEAIINALRSRM